MQNIVFMLFTEKTVIIFLNSVNQFIFVMETHCVLFAVGTVS